MEPRRTLYQVSSSPQDQKNNPIFLGLSHSGVLTFQGSRKTQHYRWTDVHKLNYEGRMFIVHITVVEVSLTH